MLVTVTIAGGEGISFNLSDSGFSYNQSNKPSQRLSHPFASQRNPRIWGGNVGGSPSKTSLNWANRAPGRAPAAALEAIIRVRGREAIGGKGE